MIEVGYLLPRTVHLVREEFLPCQRRHTWQKDQTFLCLAVGGKAHLAAHHLSKPRNL